MLFACVLACCSCGGADDSVGSSTFDELTLTSYAGFVAPSPEADCDVSLAENTFKLSATTRELSWDTCEWTAQQSVEHRVGKRILSDDAFAKIQQAYEKVAPNRAPQCVADVGSTKLEVVKHNERTLFVDDMTSGCGSPPEGVAVKGLSELRAAMDAAR